MDHHQYFHQLHQQVEVEEDFTLQLDNQEDLEVVEQESVIQFQLLVEQVIVHQ
jgi:hypothetical protein